MEPTPGFEPGASSLPRKCSTPELCGPRFKPLCPASSRMERVMGIEPTSSAWKAEVLPLNYTRNQNTEDKSLKTELINRAHLPNLAASIVCFLPYVCWCSPIPSSVFCPPPSEWWRGEDSNLRRLSRQIYSLIPLTAWVPLLRFAEGKHAILPQTHECSQHSFRA